MSKSSQAAEQPPLVNIDYKGISVEAYLASTHAVPETAFIIREILLDDCYLKHGLHIKPGATVVDVGANIGLFGVRALSAVPGGDVTYIGIEPAPANFTALQYNLLGGTASAGSAAAGQSFFHLNTTYAGAVAPPTAGRISPAYSGNIMLFNKAVSSHSGTLAMTFFPHMPGNSTLRFQEKHALQHCLMPVAFEAAEQFEVPVVTLNQLLQEAVPDSRPIDLLKVDVEGEELRVLQGLSEPGWRRVQQVVVEVHDCLPGEFDEPSAGGDDAAAAPRSRPDAIDSPQAPPPPLVAAATATAAGDAAAVAGSAAGDAAARQPDDGDPIVAALAAAMGGSSALMARAPPVLSGPRGGGIDGEWIRFVSNQILSYDVGGASVTQPAVPPRDQGRVMEVARMLKGLGFRVVVECCLLIRGVPVNYNVYACRAAA